MPGILLLIAIAAFAALLLARTAAFKPRPVPKAAYTPVEVDADKTVAHLAAMIRCRTVSSEDKTLEDDGEFEKFFVLLPTLYPKVHEACTCTRIKRGLMFHWKGREAGEPAVFMAHFDVVASKEDAWEKPPFAGVVENDVLWGRGTLDTKGTLAGVMEAAEQLIGEGFVPQKDVYFCFAGDEEISGESAPAIVEQFAKKSIHPRFVLDEGGAVVEGVFPGVTQPCALIGIGEKGHINVRFSVDSSGGHASAPPPHTPVGYLAQACCKVENCPFPMQITKPAAEMFDTLGRHSSFLYRMIFANLWLFKPSLDRLCRKSGGEMNALLRTTVAFTQMEASPAPNVLPTAASMTANLRLIGKDSPEHTISYMKEAVSNDRVKLEVLPGGSMASVVSRTDGEGWEKLKAAVTETWPEAIVSPYLMIAGSDARHYGKISDCVYRFSAMALSKAEREMIHGDNERIPCEKVAETVRFYVRLMKKM